MPLEKITSLIISSTVLQYEHKLDIVEISTNITSRYSSLKLWISTPMTTG